MKRTLIQLDEQMYRDLRQRAFREERSIASLVREMVAKGLQETRARVRPRRAAQFSSVRAGRSTHARTSRISEKHDEALAASFKK